MTTDGVGEDQGLCAVCAGLRRPRGRAEADPSRCASRHLQRLPLTPRWRGKALLTSAPPSPPGGGGRFFISTSPPSPPGGGGRRSFTPAPPPSPRRRGEALLIPALPRCNSRLCQPRSSACGGSESGETRPAPAQVPVVVLVPLAPSIATGRGRARVGRVNQARCGAMRHDCAALCHPQQRIDQRSVWRRRQSCQGPPGRAPSHPIH